MRRGGLTARCHSLERRLPRADRPRNMHLSIIRTALVVAVIAIRPAAGQRVDSSRASTRSVNPAARVDEWHERVVRAAGLAPLRATTVRRGDREIRIWIGGGFTAPSWLYRLRSRHGVVNGEIIWYWMAPASAIHEDSAIRASLGDACTEFSHRDDASTCRTRFAIRPSWSTVFDSIGALGIWTMPDPPPPPPNVVTTDGWSVEVELRDGGTYRTYEYANPDVHSSISSVARVAQISRTFRSVDSLIVPWGPDAHRASPRQKTDTAHPAAAHVEQATHADERSVRVARAAGLVALADAPLAPGDREARIWLDRGLVNPFWMYRLVSRNGRATGELVFYWYAPQAADSGFDHGVRAWIGDSCDRMVIAQDVRVCHGRFAHAPSWGALLRTVDSLGLWTLPDPATLPRDHVLMLDGSIVRVELRDGGTFRSFDYGFPGGHPTWPSDARMAAILRALDTVESSLVCRQPTACWMSAGN